MKCFISGFFILTSIIGDASSFAKRNVCEIVNENTANNDSTVSIKIKITVNSQSFTATLFDNNAAKAFKEMLPLRVKMIELNGNEKYFDLQDKLPSNSSSPGTIQNGDIMLYGSKTLVLFYKSFSTSYSYTKLGRIEDPSRLANVLGSGNVQVTIELTK